MSSQNLNDAVDLEDLTGKEYMKITHTAWIVYSMCILGMIWATIQTILINRMETDSSKVKV